jgi:hypothetical protein
MLAVRERLDDKKGSPQKLQALAETLVHRFQGSNHIRRRG